MATATVYLFHGDDEPGMQAEITAMQAKLGDATMASANTTVFAAAPPLDELGGAVRAMPFLTAKRLVIVHGITKNLSPDGRKNLIPLLESIPASTQLVLFEPPLAEEKKKSKHWLLKWAEAAGPNVAIRSFVLPQGPQMAAWLQQRAKDLGGEIKPPAAAALAQLVGSDKGAAEQEVQKLLAFVGYSRAIEASDVTTVSLPSGEHGDFFALIDALGSGNSGRAMQLLEALMEERDLILLYFSLVGHFRLLLQTRDLLDAHKSDAEIAQLLGIHPYRAQKLAGQARRFPSTSLDGIYKRLLELDEGIKTGKIEPELAMETFVASLSVQVA